MRRQRNGYLWATATALGLTLVPLVAHAETIVLRRDSVVPVVMEDTLNLKDARRGDKFFARVEGARELPYGTLIEGRVVGIRDRRGDQPASMDLEFQTMLLPDGSHSAIRAVPVRLDSSAIRRGAVGRLVASRPQDKGKFVLGGFLGGLILGNSVKKPFEGAFLGALAGIVLAETQDDGDVVARKGSKLGALFEKDVKITYNGPWDGNRNPLDRRDDRYNEENRDNRDDRYNRDDRDSRAIVLTYGRRDLSYGANETPYRIENTVMVPAERTARYLGFDSSWAGTRVLMIEDDDNLLRFESGSSDYRLNGRRARLSHPLTERNGVWYCPLDALSSLRKDSVYVNGTRVE